MWLGWSLSRAGRLDEAAEAFQIAQEQFEAYGQAYNVAWARAGQGFVALDRGDRATAEDHLRFALSIWEAPEQQTSWWAEHAMVAQTLAELARDAGEAEEAERLFQRAEDVLASPLGPMGYDRFMTQTPVEELRTRLEASRAGG
jgi:tetratricopeptide (TPR) repeat protein